MRNYPQLTEQYTSRDFINVFGGYNHNLSISEGEFYDMKNLTSSYYPVLSTRQQRGTHYDISNKGYEIVGITEKNGDMYTLEVVDDINESYMSMILRNITKKTLTTYNIKLSYDSSVKRNLVTMGDNLIIFPDKRYIKWSEVFNPPTDEDGNPLYTLHKIESSFSSDNGETAKNITFELCKLDGTPYTIQTSSPDAPTENLTNGYVWLDTSVQPNSLKVYSTTNNMWSSVTTTYVRINCLGIGANFNKDDAVRISGVTLDQWKDLNMTSAIQDKGNDYIVVIGVRSQGEDFDPNKDTESQNSELRVRRILPPMDYVFESGNRLWGCRYGINYDGVMVNEIYASKLGDFTNWEYFQGTSVDSYQLSLGVDGEFTGGISYLGLPMFFKQNCIFSISGSYPAQYRLQTTECRGVQKGCHDSLTVIDGTLYYKAVGGVCGYTGSMPVEIGSSLGEVGKRYYGACAGQYRHKYYIAMYDELDENKSIWLYVYDTEKGLWHKEDDFNGGRFYYTNAGNTEQLYYVASTTTGSKVIKSVIGEGDKADNDKIDWFAETGVIGCSSPDKKYISRMSVRLSLGIGTRVYVMIEYDSSGSWEQIGVITGNNLNTFNLPIRPKRCDHLRLKFVGTGETKIYSISKTLEQGSDV